MLYLLDANALITAHNTWYGQKRVPEFWRWLIHHGEAGLVKMPPEIYAEVEGGNDELADWMHDTATKNALLLEEAHDPATVQMVLSFYGDPLTEADLITIGQDPFLIAAAIGHADRQVVTAEVSRPGRMGARRHVPNICNDCRVRWMHPVAFIAELNFSTKWDSGL
ncbi:MAG: DUF4411 family protein [Oceanibaculum nanhaiense]|nr:DUF4411 family protein [Oceanibaculum nanhaiense]